MGSFDDLQGKVFWFGSVAGGAVTGDVVMVTSGWDCGSSAKFGVAGTSCVVLMRHSMTIGWENSKAKGRVCTSDSR